MVIGMPLLTWSCRCTHGEGLDTSNARKETDVDYKFYIVTTAKNVFDIIKAT